MHEFRRNSHGRHEFTDRKDSPSDRTSGVAGFTIRDHGGQQTTHARTIVSPRFLASPGR